MIKRSIAFKLTLGFIGIILISMLTIGILFIQMFRDYTFESREAILLGRAQSIADVLSKNTLSNGQMMGLGGFMRFLDTLTESKVWITDSNGNPAVLYGMGMGMGNGMDNGKGMGNGMAMGQFSSEPLPEEAKKVIQEVLSGKNSVSQSFSSIYKETTLTVGVPIFSADKKVIGSVFLHSPVTGITSTVNKAVNILALSLLVSLVLAIAIGLSYSVLFTRPLKAMKTTATEMANGNYYVRTGINTSDEFGQLGKSLDVLASKLGYTINQLFQEKGKLSDIISSISEGLAAFDLNLQPVSFNNSLSDIMNPSGQYEIDQIKKDFEALKINFVLENVIREKISFHIIKDWKDKRLKFTLSPILDNSGLVTGCVALVQDISESEKLEQLRKDFIANISHEFRTPLTVINGSLEALMDGTIKEKNDIERFYHRMSVETRSLQRLVGDLLELSRLQSGTISINLEKVHIPTLLTDINKSMQTIAAKKAIRIKYKSMPGIPPVIGDYDRLRQLFIIIIDNAIKYSPDNIEIYIDVMFNKTSIEVTIKDNGCGIPEKDLPYIWDRFYKTDKSRYGTGTGLGLAIAKHLIELHKGSISLKSSKGNGTEVKVFLPAEV